MMGDRGVFFDGDPGVILGIILSAALIIFCVGVAVAAPGHEEKRKCFELILTSTDMWGRHVDVHGVICEK